MSRLLRVLVVLLALVSPAAAQVSGPPHVFVVDTVANPDEVNLNFSTIYAAALNRNGGTMLGNLIFSPDNTLDIGASGATRPRDLFLGRNAAIGGTLTVTGASTFAGGVGATTFTGTIAGTALTLSSTGATAIDVEGGITAGSGNVGIVDTSGKIPAISSTFFASLSGANLTGIPETAISDGAIFPRLAATETISGAWTYSTATNFSSSTPLLRFVETDAAADNQRWWVVVNGTNWALQALNDAEGVVDNAVVVSRSGASVTSITLDAAIAFPSTISATPAVGNNNNYNPTGLSGAYLVLLTANGGGGSVITGLAGGSAGLEKTLCQPAAGPNSIDIAHENANSSAANRFNLGGGPTAINLNTTGATNGDVVGPCATFIYDGVNSRWLLKSTSHAVP